MLQSIHQATPSPETICEAFMLRSREIDDMPCVTPHHAHAHFTSHYIYMSWSWFTLLPACRYGFQSTLSTEFKVDGLTRVLLHGAYALQRSMQPKGNIVALRNLPCIKLLLTVNSVDMHKS